jgi:GlpG protein
MRIVGTIENPALCERFSTFLNEKGIEHRIELVVNKDWGSDKYGSPACQIWVIDEDQVDSAIDYLKDFKDNPDDKKFRTPSSKEAKIPSFRQLKPDRIISDEKPPSGRPGQQAAPITFYIIILCVITFTWGALTTPSFTPIPRALPVIAVFSPDINKDLMYDWPEAYSIIDKVVDLYGIESLQKPQELPPEGIILLNQYFETPIWRGFYPKLLALFGATDESLEIEAPLFEKIREGEVWRLVTPAFLHGGIIHILFNMLWLLVLGRQMEERLKPFRYILFIIIAAIIPNTFQYLMSGSNFLGFSGVLTAMIGYIWIRQKTAPWEGYILHPATLRLIAIFIFGLFAIQVIAFFVQVFFDEAFNLPIANTAHLAGAALGVILGKMKFFAWRK